ncbi:hypothetical protein D9M68_950050 [compost metagenome]
MHEFLVVDADAQAGDAHDLALQQYRVRNAFRRARFQGQHGQQLAPLQQTHMRKE